MIDRFSEDIDIAIDREYLGFSGTLSKTQISDKLRRAACSFVREQMQYDLAKQLCDFGIDKGKFNVNVDITPVSTTGPEVININYNSVVADALSLSISNEDGQYILPKVKIEVSESMGLSTRRCLRHLHFFSPLGLDLAPRLLTSSLLPLASPLLPLTSPLVPIN